MPAVDEVANGRLQLPKAHGALATVPKECDGCLVSRGIPRRCAGPQAGIGGDIGYVFPHARNLARSERRQHWHERTAKETEPGRFPCIPHTATIDVRATATPRFATIRG